MWVKVPGVKAFALPTAPIPIQTQEESGMLVAGVLADSQYPLLLWDYYDFEGKRG